MGFAAGQIVYEDDIAKLIPRTVSKGAATSRVNNTYSADPDLQGLALSPGVWSIHVSLFFTVASTTPKLRTRWWFSGGAWSEKFRACHGPGSTNTAAPDVVTPVTMRGYTFNSQDAVYNASTSTAYSAINEWCDEVTITADGNFSIEWAQVTTTAANVTLQAGSMVRATWVRD